MTCYSPFTSWFDRCVGSWNSDRSYRYFTPKGTIPQLIKTRFVTTHTGTCKYEVAWSSDMVDLSGEVLREASAGTMRLELSGDLLVRDIGYFSKEPTSCRLELVDEDTVVFHTAYGGSKYREEIRFIGDNIRLRQTIGFSEEGSLQLIGQYSETRRIDD
ncbi:putative phycobilin-lyase/ CpcV family [Synechococcus sp. SYN20]|uniref:phycobiliprotein lyase n=1 Tax=Synechococcus sp. SYN20 TaxID=1050714 RepID=UPI0016451D88|nr:phycobiliprotein lyase [Synechococcus sp. SYN20]QNJ25919.1 putative phycobilin-lyase/ CpcV family [Synechococcus sp. SYN20]